MRLFYLEHIPNIGSCAELERRDHKHLFRTLRAKIGERVELIDGKGTTAESTIEPGDLLRIVSRITAEAPTVKIRLAVAVPRRQKMDQLLRQCTEIGVSEIVPLIAERSVSVPDKSEGDERWQTLLIESCKQSRNPFMPEVTAPLSLKDFLNLRNPEEPAFFGHPPEDPAAHPIYPASFEKTVSGVWWIVGPEGGFSEPEIQQLIACGVHPVSLSPYVLRVETAAVLGAAWLVQKFCGSKDQECLI